MLKTWPLYICDSTHHISPTYFGNINLLKNNKPQCWECELILWTAGLLPCLKVLLPDPAFQIYRTVLSPLWGSPMNLEPIITRLPPPWWASRLSLPRTWASIPSFCGCQLKADWAYYCPSLSSQRPWAKPWDPVIIRGWEGFKKHPIWFFF